MPVGEKQSFRFGPFELDTQCGQLRKDGVGLKLQGQPVQILEILLEKPGQLVTREELRERLWSSDTFVDFDHSLNTAIKKLRQALGGEADTPRYIETLPKRGYRFIGEVAAEENPQARSAIDQPAGEDIVSKVTTTLVDAVLDAEANAKRRARRNLWLVTSSVALVAIAAAAAYFVVKPEPMPRIVGSHVLTKTGKPKGNDVYRPLIDRGSIYFFEERPSGWIVLDLPAEGGDVSQGPSVNGYLQDISRDGSQLLSNMYDSKRKQCDVWTQSLPAGVPRLIVKDACGPIWSADGQRVFFTRNNGTEICRANADGTGVERVATFPGDIGQLHLSPDGARIRFSGERPAFTLWEIGTDGRNLHRLLDGRKDVWGGSWSPDGKHYFFRTWDGERWSLWTVSEANHWWKKSADRQPQPLTFGPMSFGVPASSNDGRQLYAVGKEPHGELSVYDSKAGKFVPYLGGQSICYVDFSHDGQWIAYVTYPEGTLWRSRIDGSERRQLTVPPLGVMNPRWSHDGKLIAFTDLSNGDRRQMSLEYGPRRIYVVSADGGAPELLLAGRFEDPTWSPDGRSIAYAYRTTSPTHAGSEVRILDLQTQKSITVAGSQGMWSPRWSPDGTYLAALLRWPPKKLMLFNFARGSWEELASGEQFGWHSWSRDSKYLYAQDGDSLVRISIADHQREQIVSLQGFRGTAYSMDKWNQGWFGLTPDGRPITTRDTGIEELYAFDLEYK